MNEEFTEEQRRAVAAALQALQPVKGKRSTAIYIDDFAVHWHPTDKVRVLKLHPRREVAFYSSLAAMSEVLDSHPQAQLVAQDAPKQDAEDAAMWREHVGKLDALVAFCPTCCEGKVATADMTRDEVIFQCGRTSGKSEAARAAQAQGGAA